MHKNLLPTLLSLSLLLAAANVVEEQSNMLRCPLCRSSAFRP